MVSLLTLIPAHLKISFNFNEGVYLHIPADPTLKYAHLFFLVFHFLESLLYHRHTSNTF